MISCTSPSDSAYGLPISRVMRRASAPLLFSTRRPIFFMTWERIGADTAAHSFCASRAARLAATKVPASPSRTSATVSSVRAGLTEPKLPPGASSSVLPPTMEATVRAEGAVAFRASVVRISMPPEVQVFVGFPTLATHPTPKLRSPLLSSKIRVQTRQTPPGGGITHGDLGQGHSQLRGRYPAARGAQDLAPLHRGRHAGGGGGHRPGPEPLGLRRYHRPARREHREQG